jgi:uncharacterized protein YprB with RNaseH-like and TPR domain
MKIGIMDLETSGLTAESAILLCCCVKDFQMDHKGKVTTLRADTYSSWKTDRTNQRSFIKKVAEELDKFDIMVIHNGEWFDKRFFNAKCLQYQLVPVLRFKKLIDPVQLSRRHLGLSRNTLHSLIDFLNVPEHKTPIQFSLWLKAALNGDMRAMNTICDHCYWDVVTLELVYSKMTKLINRIDEKGSSF